MVKSRKKPSLKLDNLKMAQLLLQTLPDDIKQYLAGVSDWICDIGDERQIPPKQMAVAVASIIGGLVWAQTGGNVHANDEIDDFLTFAEDAMHVAVASMRIAQGWTPGGVN